MNFTTQNIEDFLLGKLIGEKKEAFEKKMSTDDSFKEEVDAHQKIFSGLAAMREEKKMKERYLDWEERLREENEDKVVPLNKNKKSGYYFKYVSIAASLLLLITFVSYFSWIKPFSNNSLYASYYNDKNISVATLSGDSNNFPIKTGLDYYYKKNYTKSIELFSSIQTENINYNSSIYYLIHALMKNNEWNNAISSINNLKEKNDIRYQEEIEWLEILCFLKTDNEKGLQDALDNILNKPNHTYQPKASLLKKDLEHSIRNVFY